MRRPFGADKCNKKTSRKNVHSLIVTEGPASDGITFMGTDLGGAVDIVQTTNYFHFGLVR